MPKNIHVMSINRSGGSLLVRLLDNHPEILAYPKETGFQIDESISPFVDKITGTPMQIKDFEYAKENGPLKYFNLYKEKTAPVHKWGKEKSDDIGVRKNYVEKVFYGNFKTDFNYNRFINMIENGFSKCRNLSDLYDLKHLSYFSAWENGKYINKFNYVVTHESGGLFLQDIRKFFKEFEKSILIIPVRDIKGYVAAEKIRIARRIYGSKRFSGFKPPNFMVKNFDYYDLENLVNTWLVAMTRIKLIHEKFDNEKIYTYRLENLTKNTENIMQEISNFCGFEFHRTLLEPTIVGENWAGNSHLGPNKGVNSNPSYYIESILNKKELDYIEKKSEKLQNIISENTQGRLNLKTCDDKFFFDYNFQSKYFDKRELIAMYYALAFKGYRKPPLKPSSFSMFLAFLFSKLQIILHLPRLIKLKLFPGLGKQNYT